MRSSVAITHSHHGPVVLLQDYDSDFEGGEADALALKEAERWEPDPGGCLPLLGWRAAMLRCMLHLDRLVAGRMEQQLAPVRLLVPAAVAQ